MYIGVYVKKGIMIMFDMYIYLVYMYIYDLRKVYVLDYCCYKFMIKGIIFK